MNKDCLADAPGRLLTLYLPESKPRDTSMSVCFAQRRISSASGSRKRWTAPPGQLASPAPPGWHAGQPALPAPGHLVRMLRNCDTLKVQCVNHILTQTYAQTGQPEENLANLPHAPLQAGVQVRLSGRLLLHLSCQLSQLLLSHLQQTLRSLYLKGRADWQLESNGLGNQ